MSNGTLHKYFLNNSKKRLHKWLHYFDIYERHFSRFQGSSPTVLEIGVMGGGSLDMWKEYFGPGSRIVGLDIDPSCVAHQAEDIDVVIGSQDDEDVVRAIKQKYPKIDIVIDDGSHFASATKASFELLYDHLAPNGVYLIEDTHTSYWEEYEGGYKKSTSLMEFVKTKLDDINAVHARGALPVSEFTRTTDSITCYDSVVVFERRRQGVRQAIITDRMG